MAAIRKATLLTVAVVSILTLAGRSAVADGNAERGKTLFRKQCATCHGADGRGHGSAAVAMKKPPVDLTDPAFWQNRTDAHTAETMREGHGHMPPLHRSDRDVADLMAYLMQAFEPASK